MKLGIENDLMVHHRSIQEGKLHQELYSCAGIKILFCYCSLSYFTEAEILFSDLILIRFYSFPWIISSLFLPQ